MKVVDAGAVVDILLGRTDHSAVVDGDLAVPHLIDSEVLNVMRRLVRDGAVTEADGTAAVASFQALSLTRYPVDWLSDRVWELRHNLSAYDAAYVALAEDPPGQIGAGPSADDDLGAH